MTPTKIKLFVKEDCRDYMRKVLDHVFHGEWILSAHLARWPLLSSPVHFLNSAFFHLRAALWLQFKVRFTSHPLMACVSQEDFPWPWKTVSGFPSAAGNISCFLPLWKPKIRPVFMYFSVYIYIIYFYILCLYYSCLNLYVLCMFIFNLYLFYIYIYT